MSARKAVPPLVLLAAVLAFYGRALDRPFTSEDFLLIRYLGENPPWHNLVAQFTEPWLGISVVKFVRPISTLLYGDAHPIDVVCGPGADRTRTRLVDAAMELTAKDLLVEANSLDNFVRNVSERLAGPALGGLVIASGQAAEDAFRFLAPSVHVSTGDRKRLDAGEVIVRALPADNGHLAVFAAVRLDALLRDHPHEWVADGEEGAFSIRAWFSSLDPARFHHLCADIHGVPDLERPGARGGGRERTTEVTGWTRPISSRSIRWQPRHRRGSLPDSQSSPLVFTRLGGATAWSPLLFR